MSVSPDYTALRKAALKVGTRITVACAVMVIAVIIAAAVFMLHQGQHPDVPSPQGPSAARIYVESKDMLEAMVVAGLAGIILAGLVGWLSARSAIRPLGDALALQRRFIQDASHELRTPLTILDARVQLAQQRTEPGSALGHALMQIRTDTAALTATVEELLIAAAGDPVDEMIESIDVGEIAERAVADLQQVAGNRGIGLSFRQDAPCRARLQSNSLRRAVVALLDNALAHTPPGGNVTVITSRQGSKSVLTVSDTGAGIRGVDHSRIFERFVRTNAIGTGSQRSFGIGLALVREIAVGAGGSVEIAGTGPDGTIMKLTLPCA
ncbi:HAMP domain-containing histidine kinase [Paenarthrobacter sp. Z7-10]|uniref:sensor histidine kinase n=1 Tax=Paenarthrobacter sp. Z7-10 TaxID=2787635 RepID=UPI0022A9CE9B|nr:HAMP domain-containing sensor histidine kinase [Paenarthrobacter sp. Z7-10]MCZ2401634.1 HAMP domain-containing histidine kinase [Paenarthrobacter sp. Z7-10]